MAYSKVSSDLLLLLNQLVDPTTNNINFNFHSLKSPAICARLRNDIRGFYDLYFARDASDKIDFPVSLTDDLRASLLVEFSNGLNPFTEVLERSVGSTNF